MRPITRLSAPGSLLVAAWLGFCAAACGNDGPECSEDDGPNILEIGDTSLASPQSFVPLESGDPMRVVITGKGFYALQPAIRVQGLWPGEPDRVGHEEDPRISIHAFLGGDFVGGTNVSGETGQVGEEEPRLGLSPTADGDELVGVALVFVDGIDPRQYLNETLELRGEVTDACDETAAAELEVVAHWEY